MQYFPGWLLSSSTWALIATAFVAILVLSLLNRILRKVLENGKFQFQLLMLCLTLMAIVIVIIASPISDTLKGQLLTLFGVLLSAVIAFASTSF